VAVSGVKEYAGAGCFAESARETFPVSDRADLFTRRNRDRQGAAQ
jgi:hypothetical protein